MNTFVKKKPTRKWTWKGPNGETKNEIDFILANNQEIVKDISENLQQKADDYQIKIQTKFDALHDKVVGMDIDSWCEKITDTITQSAMKVAGKETQSKAEKLSEETLKLLKKRMELKLEKGNQRIEYAV